MRLALPPTALITPRPMSPTQIHHHNSVISPIFGFPVTLRGLTPNCIHRLNDLLVIPDSSLTTPLTLSAMPLLQKHHFMPTCGFIFHMLLYCLAHSNSNCFQPASTAPGVACIPKWNRTPSAQFKSFEPRSTTSINKLVVLWIFSTVLRCLTTH